MRTVGARTRARWVARTRAELASARVMERLAQRIDDEVPGGDRLAQRLRLAARDEARHASMCGAVLETLQEPAPEDDDLPVLPDAESTDPTVTLLENAVFLLCAGEAIAAAMLAEASAGASEPGVADVLAEIAKDEARHAALGWAALDLLAPTLSPAARREASQVAPRQAMRAVVAAARVGPVDEDGEAWGVLSPERALAVAKEVLKTTVGPQLAARGLWAPGAA